MDNNLPIIVFNMTDGRNIDKKCPGNAWEPGADMSDNGGMIDELLVDARERMSKSVEAIRHEFGSVRTGRASPALLDRIQVDYYGAVTPLKQLATISAPEARLLTIQPYDKTSIKAIERAILESDVGLTPNNNGNLIRLGVPEAHRGAPQAARSRRASYRGGGSRRDPRRPPRRHARPP